MNRPTTPPSTARRPHLLGSLELLLPVLFLALIALGFSQRLLPDAWLDRGASASVVQRTTAPHASTREGRLVIVIVDSLRPEAMRDHMPRLDALASSPGARTLPVKTCHANLTIACVQTIFAGQESPFASGLHNFTGTQKSPVSMPHIFHAAGLTQYFISDYGMESLYPNMASESINVEKWSGSWLDHDLESIALAESWLEPGHGHDPDVLVLHVVGTDKVAHRLHPGHPEYASHFEQVDEALASLFERLDPRRDHLLVMGDHGHDAKGFHDQDSLVVMQSPVLTPLFAKGLSDVSMLHQYEMAYLFALVTHTTPPLDYEGRYLGLVPRRLEDESLDVLEDSLREMFATPLKRSPTSPMSELVTAQRDRLERAPREALMRTLPLLAIYLLWLISRFLPPHLASQQGQADAKQAPRTAHHHKGRVIGLTVLFWGTHYAGLVLPAWAALCLGVVPVVMLARLLAQRRPWGVTARTGLGLMAACVVMITTLAPLNDHWRDLMHATHGSTLASPLFFVLLIALAMGLSKLLARHATRELPLTLGSLCFFGLPAGVYYYQFGQNITRSFIIGGVIATLHTLVKKRESLKQKLRTNTNRLALALLVFGLGSLLWQRSGGWHWYSSLEMWIRLEPTWLSASLYVVMGGCLSALVGRVAGWKQAAHVAGWLVAGAAYSVRIGELTWPRADSTLMVIVTLAAWLVLSHPKEGARASRMRLLHPVFTAALLVMLFWTVFRGFEIDHVDFNFTFQYMKGLHRELEIALVSTAMTHTKYAIFLGAALAVLAALRPMRWHVWMAWVLGALHFKVICLLIQSTVGPLGGKEKLYELATIDLAFMLGLMLWLVLLSLCMTPLVERQTTDLTP